MAAPFTREELQNIRARAWNRVTPQPFLDSPDWFWTNAHVEFAVAADHLDAVLARGLWTDLKKDTLGSPATLDEDGFEKGVQPPPPTLQLAAHACITGDCPHDNAHDCLCALRAFARHP